MFDSPHDLRRPWAWLVALVLVAVALALLWWLARPAQLQQQSAPDPVAVGTARVIKKDVSAGFESFGDVQARDALSLASLVTERVERVLFDSGDRVKAGDLLIALDDRTEHYELRAARVALTEAEREVDRIVPLVKQGSMASRRLDELRTQRETARVTVARLEQALDDRAIRAPVDGVMGLRDVSPGQLVTPGEQLATLDRIDRVHVDMPLPERRLSQLHDGMLVTATSIAFPDQRFEGRISAVQSRLRAGTRSVIARAEFDNADGRLRPGMLLRLQVATPAETQLIAPEQALQSEGLQAYIYRVTDTEAGGTQRVQRLPVTVRMRQPGWVALTANGAATLKPDDRVVISGQRQLSDGRAVIFDHDADRDTANLFDATRSGAALDSHDDTHGSAP